MGEGNITITISDPVLGEREVGLDPLSIIKDQHKLLCHFRDDGRIPTQHLLDDIAVYEFILHGPNPEQLAAAYVKKSTEIWLAGRAPKKIEIAEELGWSVKGGSQ